MPEDSLSQPLSDIRVIDLSRVLAGPYCTMVLGDLGAEIIKIEQPGTGDGSRLWGPPWAGDEAAYFLSVNRNKKSLTLNLGSEKGRAILRELVKQGDVLVENFKVGTMAKWGLDYERLCQVNPRLIYASITGYGQTGPYKDRPGYDVIVQAEGGIMSITGPVEGPPTKVGVPIADMMTGMFTGQAILAALHERARSGQGQRIDLALLDAQVAWLANVAGNYLVSGQRPKRYGNAHPNIVPYEPFEARDGWLALGVGTDRHFRRFCQLAGCPDLAEDPRFFTNSKRVENREILVPMLREILKQRTTEEWQALLLEAGIPCGPVNTVDRVFAHPQVQARQMIVEVPHPTAGTLKVVNSPIKMSRTPVQMRHHPPLLGEHTGQILIGMLGYTPDEVESLRAEGVV